MRRYQRIATAMTSRGNRHPAGANDNDEVSGVTRPVSCRADGIRDGD